MNNPDDEGRQLGKLLRDVTPEFRAVDPAAVMVRPTSRRRLRGSLAVSTAVLLVIVAAVTIALIGHSTSRPDATSSRGSGTTDSASAAPSSTDARPELSARKADVIAKDAPCQKPDSAPKLADRSSVAKLRPVAVVECEYDNLVIKGSGTWAVLIRQVSVTNLDTLQARFSQLDDTRPLPPGWGCADVAHVPVPIYFADRTGRYLRPRTPSGVCGDPLPDIGPALSAIQWRTVSITKLHRTEADTEPTNPNACQWDTRSAVQQAHATETSAETSLAQQPPGKLTACIYYSLDDLGDGRLSRLLHITPGYFHPVITALSGPPPSTGTRCPAQNSFAVIHDTHGNSLTVELGGCWRVATDTPQPATVRTATPNQIPPLLAATTSGTR